MYGTIYIVAAALYMPKMEYQKLLYVQDSFANLSYREYRSIAIRSLTLLFYWQVDIADIHAMLLLALYTCMCRNHTHMCIHTSTCTTAYLKRCTCRLGIYTVLITKRVQNEFFSVLLQYLHNRTCHKDANYIFTCISASQHIKKTKSRDLYMFFIHQ